MLAVTQLASVSCVQRVKWREHSVLAEEHRTARGRITASCKKPEEEKKKKREKERERETDGGPPPAAVGCVRGAPYLCH